MNKKTNTVPYTNDFREGRTSPGFIERLEPYDPRVIGKRFVQNRADRRRQGQRGSAFVVHSGRNPVSRYVRRRQAGKASWHR